MASDNFVVIRKRRNYANKGDHPKISTDAETYRRLADVAYNSGMSISEVARQAIAYAMERLEYIDV